MNTTHIRLSLIGAALTAAFSGQALGAGFAVQNQNGAGTGTAFAGAAATAEDASTVYFNPAGMTYLPMGHSVSVAGTILHRSLDFDNTGSSQVAAPFPLGDEGGDAGGTSLVPAAFYSYAFSDRIRFGVGVSPTFGNKTEYDRTFMGRFQGYHTDLKAINVNPSVAFKVSDRLSLGAGISFVKLEGDIRQFAPLVLPGPTFVEAHNRLEADDTAWGFNLGVMYQPTADTRIGMTYRSRVDFRLRGDATLTGVGPAQVTDVTSKVELPDTFSVAVHQQISDRWEMMGDWTWTGWSTFKSLDVRNASTGARISNPNYDFKDSWRIGFGGAYKYSDDLKLRFGVAYDKTPVPDSDSRTLTLPDSDRVWVSIGARYKLTPTSSLDVGYAHLFMKDEDIDRQTVAGTTATAQFIRGSFKTSVDILSAQYNISF
ncbi:OmpP1/FadL family transporter [Methyloversatilis discipulorum]|uniref:OmpP1/FadL family transporter n=1 Tax=Methyloversatilis discipulorum TaxID=1119528 RepID=UPI0031377F10